jgi:D-3-phosphoglycerate dehydrogenase / 2-oxoglutarate reductase
MTTTSPNPLVSMTALASGAAAGRGKETGLNILIADTFEAAGVEALSQAGCAVAVKPDLTADTLPGALKELDPDVLVVRGKKVTKAAIDAGGRLSLIVRAGAGYDTIDVAAASGKGVFVANCPGKNAIAVAELAWSLILSCDRRVPDQTAELRAGKWNKKEYSEAEGLYGRTLGIIGTGQIGQEVAKRARGFGMKVVAWSRSLSQEKADELGVGFCSKLHNLAKMADVVSVNVASNDETRHLINAAFFEAMKPRAYFVNTSRGSVVDEAALVKAIKDKKLRAGLDVFENEPGGGSAEFRPAIVAEPGVYTSHHVGASTSQAQNAIAAETVRIITTYMRSGDVLNCVNRAASTVATGLLTVRHLNRPGVLAHIFYTLGQAGINVEEMENIIYEGEQAACARIQLAATPSQEHLDTIRRNENVLSVTLTSITH